MTTTNAAPTTNATLEVWAVYLLTDESPIVASIHTSESEAWEKYLTARNLLEAGYLSDNISLVVVDRVNVADEVCRVIGKQFLTDKAEREAQS